MTPPDKDLRTVYYRATTEISGTRLKSAAVAGPFPWLLIIVTPQKVNRVFSKSLIVNYIRLTFEDIYNTVQQLKSQQREGDII